MSLSVWLDRALPSERVWTILRGALALTLAVAPLAFGAVVPIAFLPLLCVAVVVGVLAWLRAWQRRSGGEAVPELAGWRLLLALHALVLAQLVPMPPFVHRLVSAGSWALHYMPMPEVPVWRALSVSPLETCWGLAFLAGMSFVYVAVAREFADERWHRRLCVSLALAGVLLSLAGLIQAASPYPTVIYGRWRPAFDWAVYGPYVNRNHFAGYLAMVTPLAIALAAEGLERAARARQRLGFWATLGGPEGTSAAWWTSLAGLSGVGLLMSQSRGGIISFGAALLVFAVMTRRRLVASGLLVGLLAGAVLSVDLGGFVGSFESRGNNRIEMWTDVVRLVPQFPVLGVGLNAFERAYRPYQTIQGRDLVLQAHNDYLQTLVETGLLGAVIVAVLLLTIARAAWRSRGSGALPAGIYAGIAASLVHATVDFNWQIPANAATFAALVGLALSPRS